MNPPIEISWGYTQFWIHDDNFTTDAAWLTRFCDLVEEENLKFTFSCMSRINFIERSPELVERLGKCGCTMMSIGIESGVPEVLESINKKLSIPQILKAVNILKKQGISYTFFMLLGSGDEFDTPEIFDKNIKFFSKLPGLVLASILTPFPGTAVYEKLKRENRIRHYNWEDYDITHCVCHCPGIGIGPLLRTSHSGNKGTGYFYDIRHIAISIVGRNRNQRLCFSQTCYITAFQCHIQSSCHGCPCRSCIINYRDDLCEDITCISASISDHPRIGICTCLRTSPRYKGA